MLPRQLGGKRAQLAEADGAKFTQAQEDAIGGAQVQVGAVQCSPVTVEGDAARLSLALSPAGWPQQF
jgi:hypothetical protein